MPLPLATESSDNPGVRVSASTVTIAALTMEASLTDQSQILDQVAAIIRDVLDPLNDHELKINSETTADRTEGWDSFNHINIVVAVEQHFGVKFKTAEIESLRNVGELVALIGRRMRVAGSA